MTGVLQAAESKLGDPYVYAATGPNAFDCSGLTQWAYGQAGIKIPRTSQEQRNAGTVISLAQAQPGDLITYSYPGQSGNPTPGNHVGMFVSPGMMIDAPHTGAVVRIEPIDTAHLDRVVHISGNNASSPDPLNTSTTNTDALVGAGINPSTWPGTALASASWINPFSTATGDVASSVTASVLSAMGPLILNGISLAAAAALIVAGFWRLTEPINQKATAAASTAVKAALL